MTDDPLPPEVFLEAVDRFLEAERRHREVGPHIWTEEQQTGHRVCGWCGYCEGGC